MSTDSQSRKWQLTINNPIEKKFTHDFIKDMLSKFTSCVYWCMSDEIGENGTYHTHLYIQCSSAVRFSTVKNRFTGAHIEMAKGTGQQNRDYVFKEGKWRGTEKEETNLVDTHEEYGQLPPERQGSRNDLSDLYDMVKDGLSNYEILESSPHYMLHIDKIERVRQSVREEQYKNQWRDLEVTYIFGMTGTGKTRGVMEKYGYSNVYRITDYDHPFDSYKGQDVIIFEEFRSSLYIDDMLKYLDGYPVELPARYMNRIACFTKVFIISNIDLRDQYPNIQKNQKATWNAFLRRIHHIKIYNGLCTVDLSLSDYFNYVNPFLIVSPFDMEEGVTDYEL